MHHRTLAQQSASFEMKCKCVLILILHNESKPSHPACTSEARNTRPLFYMDNGMKTPKLCPDSSTAQPHSRCRPARHTSHRMTQSSERQSIHCRLSHQLNRCDRARHYATSASQHGQDLQTRMSSPESFMANCHACL